MAGKRYTREDAQQLLARVVACATAGEHVRVKNARATLTALLDAPLGNTTIGDRARAELREWNTDQIRRRQRALAQFFYLFTTPVNFTIALDNLELGPARQGPRVGLRVDGSAFDVLTFQAMSLVQAVDARRLLRCPCGTVFAKVGRQDYCSETCQKRFYMRAYRAKKLEKRT